MKKKRKLIHEKMLQIFKLLYYLLKIFSYILLNDILINHTLESNKVMIEKYEA